MTNIKRQKWCDEQKWLTSEAKCSDQSGKMDWCKYCKYNDNDSCTVSQCDKVINCLCATAYNKMKRLKK